MHSNPCFHHNQNYIKYGVYFLPYHLCLGCDEPKNMRFSIEPHMCSRIERIKIGRKL